MRTVYPQRRENGSATNVVVEVQRECETVVGVGVYDVAASQEAALGLKFESVPLSRCWNPKRRPFRLKAASPCGAVVVRPARIVRLRALCRFSL